MNIYFAFFVSENLLNSPLHNNNNNKNDKWAKKTNLFKIFIPGVPGIVTLIDKNIEP